LVLLSKSSSIPFHEHSDNSITVVDVSLLRSINGTNEATPLVNRTIVVLEERGELECGDRYYDCCCSSEGRDIRNRTPRQNRLTTVPAMILGTCALVGGVVFMSISKKDDPFFAIGGFWIGVALFSALVVTPILLTGKNYSQSRFCSCAYTRLG
jgi:hypothetical protein